MPECDAETGKILWEPFARIRDYHFGYDVSINLTTLSRIGAQITPNKRLSLPNNGKWYEVSSFEGGVFGYVASSDLKLFLPQALKKLEEMVREGRSHITEEQIGNDIY
ncbi:hypothetical protein A3K62_02615 [Candidatus Pacearchaeota archaeon RBG_16_35_8]|nr:MAG: hypothetical protein A3K62_02615 [Candidatus Pacearchaeota archaeon RBG_16_35_8]